ncbi:hypothetical protein TWF703_005431 [Orbilia oligospora]|uniref:Nephrocystin 3-like N-terminal domain-containing protein n=1 Tax=Orbilia oligospora TaxID=2813651 RepID=A0A7C8JS97_ORBOL|nr:hypothetical protein TWF703_005431 [Orbilia oligospora]
MVAALPLQINTRGPPRAEGISGASSPYPESLAGPRTPRRPQTNSNFSKDSECWKQAKEIFQKQLLSKYDGTDKVHEIQARIHDFLQARDNLDGTLYQCQKLRRLAEKRYEGKIGGFIRVLQDVRDIGDPILSAAPDIVGVAWGTFSALIGITIHDMDNCDNISDTCVTVITIILTCRLYENQLINMDDGGSENPAGEFDGDRQLQEKLLSAIKEALVASLEFFWHATKKFTAEAPTRRAEDKKKLKFAKIKIFFRNIFDAETKEKYDELITHYGAVKEKAGLAFQEKVMSFLSAIRRQDKEQISRLQDLISTNTATMTEGLKRIENSMHAYMVQLITGVGVVSSTVASAKEGVDRLVDEKNVKAFRNYIESYRKRLLPNETHQIQLDATLQSLRYGKDHLCSWLFDNEAYKSWEREPPNPVPMDQQDNTNMAVSETRKRSDGPPAADGLVPQTLLYVKGLAGFGKSVMMALTIRRLKLRLRGEIPINESTSFIVKPKDQAWLETQRATAIKQDNKPLVLFWFFKKGLDATQRKEQATSSLLAQIFDERNIETNREVERFVQAIQSLERLQPQKKDCSNDKEGDQAERDQVKKKEGEEAERNFSRLLSNLSKIELIAKTLMKTVYIVVDGLDECLNYDTSDLVPELIRLSRSKEVNIKVLLSSRTDIGMERHFWKNSEAEKQLAAIDLEHDDSGDDLEYAARLSFFHERTYEETTMLTVTELTNSRDMVEYLNMSLRHVMKQRMPRAYHPDKGGKVSLRLKSGRLRNEIEALVQKIRSKSKGMFTYCAMVITSLEQPSELSLAERLGDLPTGMNELYSQQLASLTDAERNLVMLALRRIMYSPSVVNTIEIAEQFKKIYLKEGEVEDGVSGDDYNDCGDESPESSINGDDIDVAPNHGQSEQSEMNTEDALEHPRDASEKSFREEQFERAMQNPEIFATVNHLSVAGRDFFKFLNDKRNINVIHTTVREWFERETREAAKKDYSIRDLFRVREDKEKGDMVLRLRIPKRYAQADFEDEKHTELDILIYLLQVLTNQKFQQAYLPRFPDEDEGILEPRENEPWRGEIVHWTHHMRRVGELWPPEERTTKKWHTMREYLRKLLQPEIFKRWALQYGLQTGVDLGMIRGYAVASRPAITGSVFGLEVLIDFLLKAEDLQHEITYITPAKHTILHYPAIFSFPELVLEIIKRGVAINSHCTCSADNTAFMTCLREVGFFDLHAESLDTEGQDKRDKLIQSLKYMIENGADLNMPLTRAPQLPLQRIIAIGDSSLFELALSRVDAMAVDLELHDDNQRTALHTVLSKRCKLPNNLQLAFAKKLLQKGANPNAEDKHSRTPLYKAVSAKNLDAVRLLLDYGHNVDFMVNDDDVHGETALTKIAMEASTPEDLKIIDFLVEKGANLQYLSTWSGRNALCTAIYYEKWAAVDSLLKKHKKVYGEVYTGLSQKDADGETILHRAVSDVNGRDMIDHILGALTPLESNTLLEEKGGIQQMTPFHKAIDSGYLNHAAYLLDFGASPFVVDSKSMAAGSRFLQQFVSSETFPQPDTPLFIAHRKLFRAFAFAPNCRGYDQIFDGSSKVLESYLNLELDPLVPIEDGWTALDFAYAFGKQSTMQGRVANYDHMISNRLQEWRSIFKPLQQWGVQMSHAGAEISSDGLTCSVRIGQDGTEEQSEEDTIEKKIARIHTNKPIAPYDENFYFEVQISVDEENARKFEIGLTRDPYTTDFLPDSENEMRHQFSEASNNDIFGCGYHQKEGVIFWTVNGIVVKSSREGIRGKLYPMFAGLGIFVVKANFAGPFQWHNNAEELDVDSQ